MSKNEAVNPSGIPVFTGNLALLDRSVGALAKSGESIATAAGDVHSSFGGLQAFYKAPEADQLFATTKPVADRGTSLKSDLTTITGALSTYSDDAYPLVEKLKELKREADAFVVQIRDDDKWREDGDLVDENNHRHDEVIEAWTAFQAVERACHDKIVALVGGSSLKIDDGSGKKGTYGYEAEALKHAEGLPWGDPVEESKPWYQLHEHAWDFIKGFAVDGVWGTIKGLGTLVGTDGWDSAKQAWSGLGKLATGLTISILPMGNLLWAVPEDKLPSYLRDSRRAMKETGKALLAWDQWGENPSRAAGAVTFNVITTVFTGGTGGAASGAGKAALAAKALSTAGKVGRFVDPMTYVFKGAGMGLTKIGDVMAGFKGLGTTEIPPLPEGVVTLPEGGFKLADGTLHLPEGSAIPDSAFEVPSNSFKLPDGAEIPAGAIDLGDGVVRLPEGMAPPSGSLRIPEGALKLPEGTTALPENVLKGTDEHGNTVYLDRPGNVLKEDGTLKQHHSAAKPEDVATGAETPAALTPAQQPVLVGAHSVGGSTGGAIRMGDDLRGVGRAGDDASGAGRTPGGSANNLPGGSAGDYLPSNSLDGGRAGASGGHHPTNNLDGGRPGGGHPDLGASGGHDVPDNAGAATAGADAADGATASPSHRADEGAAAGNGGSAAERELTAAERKKLQDRHVWLANNNDVWRDAYYRGDGHRWDKNVKVDGVELPILKKNANGTWVAKYDLPHGPSEIKHSRTPLKPDSADPSHLPQLDEAAKNSRVSVDLSNAERAFKDDPSPQNHSDLDTATGAYRDQLADIPNNSKHSERLGEEASRLHAIPKIFPGAKYVDLPRTPNGANMLDDLYEIGDDGSYLVVEQKGPKASLNPPRLGAGPAANMMVKQGTRPYLETIFHEMWKRGGKDRQLAEKLFDALENKKLQYVLVKGKESAGSYDGSVLEHFKIY
ncbi:MULTISPECIES: hypothetical protein [unclassified Streptomyces]|uniref:hypothetical protein n=1 Tax=unclassified Streptomyces TaxID=2593676 RepID=UPI000F464351|nr:MULTISPECIES: hypothetical protein [unclassified Streptomyces]MCX4772464.1 hypothetical protein [Streptomyces sp. NBC_01285]ROQ71564.1 hypothetical protein EDD95_7680 [Streptomyces sp. CEV 2-1]